MLSVNFPLAPKQHGLSEPLIVSLTSYPKRFKTLPLTLQSLLSQTVRPDRIVLWVAHDDKNSLTNEVLSFRSKGVEIRFCEELRSFNKIIPSLGAFLCSYIATADDDIYYYPTWLEELVGCYDPKEKAIPAHRVHRIVLDAQGGPCPYKSWIWNYRDSLAGNALNFPTGVGGVLYPPSCFHKDVMDKSIFGQLSPFNDDIWLYWMANLAGYRFKPTGSPMKLVAWPSSQDSSLFSGNIVGRNDLQVSNMLSHYGMPSDNVESISDSFADIFLAPPARFD